MKTVYGVANLEKEREQRYAAIGVQELQRGNQELAYRYFIEAAAHRAEYYEYCATGDELRVLTAERSAEMMRRRNEVVRKYRADHGPTT